MPKRILQGVVVSDVQSKTIIVRVDRRVMHPIYKKYVTRSKKYAAHDEENQFHTGDAVSIEESRPISKRKSWIVIGGPEGAEAGRRKAQPAPAAAAAPAPAPEPAEEAAEEIGGAA
jgi:small subunit ribosomal protein S17